MVYNWTVVDNNVKTTPKWFGIPASIRAHHHQLEIYCYRNELGDRIEGARSFKRTEWAIVAGTDGRAIRRVVEAGLASWDGDDLVVAHVCVAGQRLAELRRRIGRISGRLSPLTKQKQQLEKAKKSTDTVDAQIKQIHTLIKTMRATLMVTQRASLWGTEAEVEVEAEADDLSSDPTPKSPTLPGRGPLPPSASGTDEIAQLRAAWPRDRRFNERAVMRALRKVGAENDVDQVARGMRFHTSDPAWKKGNSATTAKSYIEGGDWRHLPPPKQKPMKAAPAEAGTNGSNGHPDPTWARIEELVKSGKSRAEAAEIVEREQAAR